MNQVDKVDQFLRLLILAKPDQYWPAQSLIIPESVTMSESQKNRLLESLTQKYATPTFGQLLSERFRTTSLSAALLAGELGVPVEVIDCLVSDSVHPATVPIMVMKRLLERVNVTLDLARSALRATFDQLKASQSARPVGFGLAARKASNMDTNRSVTGIDDTVGSEESLNQYLDRLAGFMPS